MFTDSEGREYPPLSKRSMESLDAMTSACNGSGVLFQFTKTPGVLDDMCDQANALDKSTEWKNHHPAVIILTDKLAQLSGQSFATGDSLNSYQWLSDGLKETEALRS